MVKFILKILKNRTKSWKTTLVGLAILIVVAHLLYLGKTTITESITLSMVGLSLFLSDDTLFLKNFMPKRKEEEENIQNQE